MDLARASKENLLALFRAFMRSPATVVWEADGIACWQTPLAHPFFNGIILCRAARPNDNMTLATAIAPFTRSPSTPFTLWIEADVPRDPWHPYLEALGFVHDSGAPVMALALDALPPQPLLPRGFTIEPVTDLSTLRTWSEIFINAYEFPSAWGEDFFALMQGIGLDLPFAHFLGRLDGRPVATSSLFFTGGVAGVNFVATLPHARRRGLGGFMTMQPLYSARQVDHAVLQASEMGYNLYKEMGFAHVGNVDNEYLPAAE